MYCRTVCSLFNADQQILQLDSIALRQWQYIDQACPMKQLQ